VSRESLRGTDSPPSRNTFRPPGDPAAARDEPNRRGRIHEPLFVTGRIGSSVAATEQETERRLLLELAKEAFAKQVAKRVRPLSRGYVERWMKGEFWLYPDVVSRHATELRAFKPVVLEVLRATSVEEMIGICRRTRPDLTYLWHEPAARAKLAREIAEAIKTVEAL
jgi:hypothetical protein